MDTPPLLRLGSRGSVILLQLQHGVQLVSQVREHRADIVKDVSGGSVNGKSLSCIIVTFTLAASVKVRRESRKVTSSQDSFVFPLAISLCSIFIFMYYVNENLCRYKEQNYEQSYIVTFVFPFFMKEIFMYFMFLFYFTFSPDVRARGRGRGRRLSVVSPLPVKWNH